MKKSALTILFLTALFGLFIFKSKNNSTGAPPYQGEDLRPPDGNFDWISNWQRPEGPLKVGLQVGHWKNDELPDELSRLRGNTGSSGGGMSEWEVNMKIAEITKEILENNKVLVEILPSTIPKNFWADIFIAIHADGSTDRFATGFKAATPRRDYTGKANSLLSYVEDEYQKNTQMTKDGNVSRNMTGYYAFSWWRYDHAVHPMTTSLILETGFLTNPTDRKIIVSNPQKSAQGLASGIIKFLENENLIE